MSRVIGISSGKGGVGKTTLTANLAIALGKLGKKVLMVDCNLSTPHLSYYLGVNDYTITLNDIMSKKAKSDEPLYNYDGVRFLPASLNLDDVVDLDLKEFKKTIGKLKNPDRFDYILLDSAPGLGRESVSVLNASDEILFVTIPFPAMINDVIRSMEVLKQLGRKKVGIVLNMSDNKRHELFASTIEKVTGVPVVGRVPFDDNMVYSLSMNTPILQFNPLSDSSIGFMKLAAVLSDSMYEEPSIVKRAVNKIKSKISNQRIRMFQEGEDLDNEIYIQEGQKGQKLRKLF